MTVKTSYIADASERLSQLPLVNNLEMVNNVLEKLEISTIKKKALADNTVIEKKIREIGDAIGRKLKIDQTLSVGIL